MQTQTQTRARLATAVLGQRVETGGLDAAMRFPVVEQPADLFERDGFRHEEVDAAGEGLALVSAGREARQRDDQSRGGPVVVVFSVVVVAAGFLDVADGAGGFEAVHDRHAYICGWPED